LSRFNRTGVIIFGGFLDVVRGEFSE